MDHHILQKILPFHQRRGFALESGCDLIKTLSFTCNVRWCLFSLSFLARFDLILSILFLVSTNFCSMGRSFTKGLLIYFSQNQISLVPNCNLLGVKPVVSWYSSVRQLLISGIYFTHLLCCQEQYVLKHLLISVMGRSAKLNWG